MALNFLNNGIFTGAVTAPSFTGDLTATSILINGVTAFTQSANDNSTKVATTAYVDGAGGVTTINTGGGLDGGPITASGTIEVEYDGVATNILQSGFDFTGDTVVSGDLIMISAPGATSTYRRIGYVTVSDLLAAGGSGTVTGITEGPGITVTASATSPTVAVDYIGTDSLVMEAADAVPDQDDYIIFGADSSGSGDTNKIQFTDVNLSLFNNDSGFTSNAGTVTSVGSGTGLTGGPFTVSGSIAVDYVGTDSIIKAAPTLSAAVALTDFLLVAGSNGNVYETTFSNLPLDNYNRWRVQANTGLVYNITSDTNVDFIGGTNISTSTGTQTGGLTVTINNDLTNNNQLTNGAGYITAGSLPTVNNATITIAAGTNLTTGGAFTTNQSVNETITINMATGGAGAGFYGSTSNSIKIDQITLDAYGRVTAVSTGATGQVNTVATGNSSTLTSTGTTAKTLTPVTAAVSSGSAALATGAQIQTAINTALLGVLSYQGTWNASTNSPALASGVGTPGYYYIVDTAGSTNLDGITDWAVGDWAVFSDLATDAWQKIDNTQVGNVTGSGSSGRVAYWNSTSNITSSANMTFNGANLGVSGIMSASGGNSTEWNDAYDNKITTFTDSGTSTVTLTLTQQDGGTLSTSFSVPQGTVTGGPYLKDTTDTFTGSLTIVGDIRGSGQQLILNAGESYGYATGQTNEYVYANAENGLIVSSSPDNWGSGWAGRNTAFINQADASSVFPGDIKIESALLSNQENTNIDAATSPELVAQVSTSTYTAAFFDFVIKKTTNVRSGTVYACHDGTNVKFTETSTQDLGDTSDVTLSVDKSGTNMRLLATVTSDDWSVKSLIRAI